MSRELHPKDGHANMAPISFNSWRTLLGILAIAAAAMPGNRAGLVYSASRLSLMPDGAPLYARDCARLI